MKDQMYYDIYLLNMTSNINKGCKKYSWAGNEGRAWAVIVYKMLFIYSRGQFALKGSFYFILWGVGALHPFWPENSIKPYISLIKG